MFSAGCPWVWMKTSFLPAFKRLGFAGREIGDEIGVGPFNEALIGLLTSHSRPGSHDQHIAFPNAFQDGSQVIPRTHLSDLVLQAMHAWQPRYWSSFRTKV
jgi:hypothetical protein